MLQAHYSSLYRYYAQSDGSTALYMLGYRAKLPDVVRTLKPYAGACYSLEGMLTSLAIPKCIELAIVGVSTRLRTRSSMLNMYSQPLVLTRLGICRASSQSSLRRKGASGNYSLNFQRSISTRAGKACSSLTSQTRARTERSKFQRSRDRLAFLANIAILSLKIDIVG